MTEQRRKYLLNWYYTNRSNSESYKEKRKEYYRKNKKKMSISNREYYKNKRKESPELKLRMNLRNRINMALKNNQKSGSAIKDLGCTVEQLKTYLENKFIPGMSWENYGKGPQKWQIDHIIPLFTFDLTDREQFLIASHYTNLQPLWYDEHLIKTQIDMR